jgi:hypothetical protein
MAERRTSTTESYYETTRRPPPSRPVINGSALRFGYARPKRPVPRDAVTARRILIGGLAQDAGIFEILSELAPLHPRNDTFPGEVFLRLGADAPDQCGASRADPVALEDSGSVPARVHLPRAGQAQAPVRCPGRGGAARRSRAGPGRRGRLVADRRLLAVRLVRSDRLYPRRRRPSGCARAPGMPGATPACIAPQSVSLSRLPNVSREATGRYLSPTGVISPNTSRALSLPSCWGRITPCSWATSGPRWAP